MKMNTWLFNDDDDVIKLLSLQERMHVAQENSQMFCSISYGHNDGHLMSGSTFTRLVTTASFHSGLFHPELNDGFVFLRHGWHCFQRKVCPTNFPTPIFEDDYTVWIKITTIANSLLNLGEIRGHGWTDWVAANSFPSALVFEWIQRTQMDIVMNVINTGRIMTRKWATWLQYMSAGSRGVRCTARPVQNRNTVLITTMHPISTTTSPQHSSPRTGFRATSFPSCHSENCH